MKRNRGYIGCRKARVAGAASLICLLALIAFTAIIIVNSGSDPSANTKSSQSISKDEKNSASVSTRSKKLTKENATKVLKTFMREAESVRAPASRSKENTKAKPTMKGIASDLMINELESERQELESNGWVISGRPEIADVKVLEKKMDASKPTVKVSACVNSKDVKTLDSQGQPIKGGGSENARARHIFTLKQYDKNWRVAARSFPDNPDC